MFLEDHIFTRNYSQVFFLLIISLLEALEVHLSNVGKQGSQHSGWGLMINPVLSYTAITALLLTNME